jgi:drug/metabolite transporter (DMT)-like permease
MAGLKLVNKKDNIQLKKIYNLNKKESLVLISGGLISLIGAMMFLYLIKMEDITKVVSFSQSLTIILSIMIGYLFFSEKLYPKDILGILLIVSGITMIKYKNN